MSAVQLVCSLDCMPAVCLSIGSPRQQPLVVDQLFLLHKAALSVPHSSLAFFVYKASLRAVCRLGKAWAAAHMAASSRAR